MMPYSQEQRVWMVQRFFETKNAAQVKRDWTQNFPPPPPAKNTVLRVVDKFQQSGSVQNLPKNRQPTALTTENTELIRDMFEENPHSSVRNVAPTRAVVFWTAVTDVCKRVVVISYKVSVFLYFKPKFMEIAQKLTKISNFEIVPFFAGHPLFTIRTAMSY
jgi:hypothetical protein